MHKIALAFILIFSLNACSTLQSGSTCVVEDNYFAANRLLTWSEDFARINSDPLNAIGPVTLEQIKMEIENQFQILGYNFTDEKSSADMRVSFVVATREEIVNEAYVYNDPYCWGTFRYPVFAPGRDRISKEAFLAIDLVEVQTNRSVWRGWAEQPVNEYDRHNPESLIKTAITSILEELPAVLIVRQ